MYFIGTAIYGLNKEEIIDWLGEDLTDLGIEIELINQNYCGVDLDTEYLGAEINSFNVTEPIKETELWDGFKEVEALNKYKEKAERLLEAFVEDNDITIAQKIDFLASLPKPTKQIVWSTS